MEFLRRFTSRRQGDIISHPSSSIDNILGNNSTSMILRQDNKHFTFKKNERGSSTRNISTKSSLYKKFVGKLKEAKRRMSRYSLKRKSVLFKANSHLLINQFSWINSINDEYSNAKITRSKIASTKYHYYCYYLKKVNNEIVRLSFISIITSIVISELYIFKTNNFLNKINPDERKNSNFYYQSEFFSMKYFEQMEEREISKVENGFIIFNIVISSLISLLLWIKVTLVVNKMYVEKSSSKYDNVFSLWLFPKYLIESVIALIFFLPNVNVIYTQKVGENYSIYPLTGIILLLSFIKFYIIFDNKNPFFKFNSKVAKSVCKNNKSKPGYHFAIKCFIKTHPFVNLIIQIGFSLIILTSLLRIQR